ncbi:MAG: hypothetical protein J5858_16570 [Lentisphaeria bacterium]|nr:hypothetical protein [Lentisphaeria bacterium]
MITLTIDIKARSCVSIKTQGIFAYAQNKSTQVICVTLKRSLEPPVVWLPPELRKREISGISDDQIRQMLEEADLIQAYDITTEFALWKYTLCRLYPWFPKVPVQKLSCIAARAAYLGMGLPLSVLREKLGIRPEEALQTPEGTAIFTNPMKKIPPESLQLFLKSCMDSVASEAEIANKIIVLPQTEQQIWRAVLAMNDRGILIHRDTILNHLEKAVCEEEMLNEEFYAITGISNPMNGDAVMAYFNQHGVALKSLGQTDLDRAIRALPQGILHRAVAIRRRLAEKRPLCCKRLLSLAGTDSRIRGIWEYYGNSSGCCRIRYLPDIGDISGFMEAGPDNIFRICRFRSIQNMLSFWTNSPERNQRLVAHELKDYCKAAVLKPGIALYYGKLKISCFNQFLKIVLPSGRDFFLYEPELDKTWHLFCQFKYGRVIQRMELSGGMLFQMIENAVKRDIVMFYLLQLAQNRFTPVLIDAKEIVAEDSVFTEADDFFSEIIADQPPWLEDSSPQPVMCLCHQWSKQS